MDKTKIENILDTYFGISNPFNKWMKLPQVSTIYLNIDPNLFISNDELYYFDSNKKLILISRSGSYKNIETISADKNAYPISAVFSFDCIAGFIGSTSPVAYGTYYTKMF